MHIMSENKMMKNSEDFSFFESAILDKIYHDLHSMDYQDFEIIFKSFKVQTVYDEQSAQLSFSGDVSVVMRLTFDDLVPCFTAYDAIR